MSFSGKDKYKFPLQKTDNKEKVEFYEMQGLSPEPQSSTGATNTPVSDEEKQLLCKDKNPTSTSAQNEGFTATNRDSSSRPDDSDEPKPSTSKPPRHNNPIDVITVDASKPSTSTEPTPRVDAGSSSENPTASTDRPSNPDRNSRTPSSNVDVFSGDPPSNEEAVVTNWLYYINLCHWPKLWRRVPKFYQRLCIAIIVVFAIPCIGLSTASYIYNKSEAQPQTNDNGEEKLFENLSYRPSCSDSYSILKNMDYSVDPCDNFYQFVCGKFVNRTLVPTEATTVSALSDMMDSFDALINTMIDEIKPSAPRPFQLVKRFYQTCMDQTRINEIGDATLRRIVSDLGGWPVLEGEKWNENGFNWMESIYKVELLGIHNNFFIDIGIQNDMNSNDKMIITVGQAVLGLNKRILTDYADPKSIAKTYFNYMINVAMMFGAEKNRAISDLLQVLDFERSIAHNLISMDQLRNKTSFYRPYNIDTLSKDKPFLDWVTLFRNLSAPDATIGYSQKVIVAAPDFIDELVKTIVKTPKRTVANYVIWRAIASCMPYLHEPLRKLHFAAEKNQTGISGGGERWKECTVLTITKLPLAVSSLYVRKYFPNEAKVKAQVMADSIHAEFFKILKNVKWMDNRTRRGAIKKAKAMTKHIGYPIELLDDKKLETHYKSLRISGFDFLGSVLNISLFDLNFKFSRLHTPVSKYDWRDHGSVTVITARHNILENSIEIPAGMLHGHMFDANRPRYMNYAAVGVVIGHEIIHGFDDVGRQFDQDGNLAQLWESETSAKFVEKTRCFIEQHDNFTIDGNKMPSPGNITQGEIIADNAGVKIAYLAYQKWAAANPPEMLLPALNYTTNQTFWITAASIWCTKHKEQIYNIISPHPLEHFRVVQTLRNSEIFANDFNCTKGSGMNPEKKCQIW